MKAFFQFAMVVCSTIIFFSCSKDNEIEIEEHDDNKIMREIHVMMNKMDTMDMSGDPDHHFAKMMVMHHQGAIDMSNIVLSDGDDTAIRRMAQMVVQKQTQEINALRSFLNSHSPHAENAEFNMKMEMSMMKMDRNADLQIINGDMDHDYAILLIFHHQSAIEMADLVIHYGHETMIRNMAMMMKEDQEKEIEELQKWLLEDGR